MAACRSNAPMPAPWLDLVVSRCSRTDLSRLLLRPYPCTRRRVNTRLVLPNDLDAWLQLRYAHTYVRTPLERTYTRPLTRRLCLTTLAYSPVSLVPMTLPDAAVGGWIRHWRLPTARLRGYSCGMRMRAIDHRSNAPMLAPWLDLLVSQFSRTNQSRLCPRPYRYTFRRLSTRLVLSKGLGVCPQLRYANM